MKIIILGAGQIGSSLAASLVHENNDVTVVDADLASLQSLEERNDLSTVHGIASHPSVLEKAGGREADMIIAVTDNDECNMLACQVAYTLFHTPTKIARVRSNEYLTRKALFAQEALPIDVLISPESLVTEYVEKLVHYPNTLQVVDFAGGKAQLVAIRCCPQDALAGRRIADAGMSVPDWDLRIAAIYRGDTPIMPTGDTRITPRDEVFCIGSGPNIREFTKKLHPDIKTVKRIVLAGGGNIGVKLASALERNYQVKLIERNAEQARSASEQLRNTIVLHGSATDSELLREENIDNTDLFCAVTNSDETNIISAMLAKQFGALKVIALVNQPDFLKLVKSDVIDMIIFPQQAVIGSLLAHVRRGDMVVVHSLRRGTAEVLEAIVHGDQRSSKIAGRSIVEVNLPENTNIGAIVRGDDVIIAHHDTVIESGDHVILLVADKKAIPEVERLFQVGATYL